MSKIKDLIIDVVEKFEAGVKEDEIAYYISYTYDIPFDFEVREIISKIQSTMNLTNECIEEVCERY